MTLTRIRVVSFIAIFWGLAMLANAQDAAQSRSPDSDQSQPRRVRVSEGVMKAMLIKRVAPQYPDKARSRHLEGAVVMKILIGKAGDVEEVEVTSGDELFV